MKNLVIYHRADYDGEFCHRIARKFLPEDTEFIGWDHGDAPVKPTADFNAVYILDLPCDKPLGIEPERLTGCTNLIWIDHHKSAIETHPKELQGYRIDGVAACRLAWQWFSEFAMHDQDAECHASIPGSHLPQKQHFIDRKVQEPMAVQLAGEYDVWDHRNPDAAVFQFGLDSTDLDDTVWKELLDVKAFGIFAALLERGRNAQRCFAKRDADIMAHRSFTVEWEGLKWLCLNTARCNSNTFASAVKPYHDALMGFYWNGSAWTVSMYHAPHRTDLDLLKIAVKYGGGGHRGACGFRLSFEQRHICPWFPYVP